MPDRWSPQGHRTRRLRSGRLDPLATFRCFALQYAADRPAPPDSHRARRLHGVWQQPPTGSRRSCTPTSRSFRQRITRTSERRSRCGLAQARWQRWTQRPSGKSMTSLSPASILRLTTNRLSSRHGPTLQHQSHRKARRKRRSRGWPKLVSIAYRQFAVCHFGGRTQQRVSFTEALGRPCVRSRLPKSHWVQAPSSVEMI